MAGNQRPDLMWCVETWVLAPDTLSGSPAHTWCHCAKGINSQTPTGGRPKTHREGLDGLAKEWSTLSDPTKDKSPKAQLVRAKARSPNLAFIHLSKDINFMMTRGQSCSDQVGGCGQVLLSGALPASPSWVHQSWWCSKSLPWSPLGQWHFWSLLLLCGMRRACYSTFITSFL